MRVIPAFAILLLLSGCDNSQKASKDRPLAPVYVENSGNAQVDALVAKLVSPVPAPYPNRIHDMTDPYFLAVLGNIDPQVAHAWSALEQLGTVVYPALIKHLRDDRYSFSRDVQAWRNHTVGDAVMEILAAGPTYYGVYPSRETPDGGSVSMLFFTDYLKEQDLEKWAQWATTVTKADIQIAFITWGMKKEEERGFTSPEDREAVLGDYRRALSKYQKAAPAAPADEKMGR